MATPVLDHSGSALFFIVRCVICLLLLPMRNRDATTVHLLFCLLPLVYLLFVYLILPHGKLGTGF